MYEYEDVAAAYLNRPSVDWQRYPCVASAWDNTPRRQTGEALILHNSTPEAYGWWLAEAATRQHQAAGSNGIVFVNAWNEWAEGAHLEPDVFWGRAYLETTRDVMRDLFGDSRVVPEEGEPVHPSPVPSEELYDDLYEKVVQLQKSSTGFLSFADRRMREMKKYYESKLSWERLHAAQVMEMNEWLTEQLKTQSEQMNALAVPGVASTKWLDDPPPPVESPEEDTDPENETAPQAKSDDLRDGEDEDAPLSWRMTLETDADDEDDVAQATGNDPEAEDRRRDDGYDDPPGVRSPQWLVELEAPE
jgi:hypothetical protein